MNRCPWCGVVCEYTAEMDGCCSLDCRYLLARDEGWVGDREHEANLREGWAPRSGV